MEIRQSTLSSWLAVAVAGLASACEAHITKVPVAEVPVAQFQGTPVTLEQSAPQAPPIVEGNTVTTTPATSVAATTTTASTPATAAAAPAAAPVAGAAAGPVPAAAPDAAGGSADDKVKTATKLMNSGKRPDLLAARKMLVADVGAGVGTQDEVHLLLKVCAKLGDKPCITKANSYLK